MKHFRLAAGICAFVVCAAVVVVRWPRPHHGNVTAQSLRSALVSNGELQVTLRVPGTLDAERSIPVKCDTGQTQIVWVLTDGETVKPGQVILRLDDTAAKKALTTQETQDAVAMEQERSQLAEGQKRIQNAQTALEKAKDDLKLAQVQSKASHERSDAELAFSRQELVLAKTKLDKKKRLVAEKLMPVQDLESAEEDVRQREFELAKVDRAQEKAQKDVLADEEAKKLAIRKAELEIEMAKSALAQMMADQATNQASRGERLADLQKRLTGTQIIAPAVGMLLLDTTWEEQRRPLRIGDRVGEGQVVANIIDPNNMRVSCDINAGDIERVKTSQKVFIRVPALGNIICQGKIQAIGNLAREQSMWEGGTPGKQVFSALIEVTSKEKRLRPGMSATVEILLDETKKSTLVPIEAIFSKGKNEYVYVLKKGRYRQTPVRIVSRNEIQASITGVVHAGDRVACEQPK